MENQINTTEHSPENKEASDTTGSEEKKQSVMQKIKRWYSRLPDKKIYLEFITALLTIPVLLTVIISNVQNLQKQNTPTPTPQVTSTPALPDDKRMPKEPKNIFDPTMTTPIPTMTPSAQCKKEVGPINILYPEEGTTLSKDPICLDIVRTGEDYCAVVWSYRINNGNWSDYTDKSICIYGLSSGTKNVELRVKSIVTGNETILTRSFIVAGTTTPTPTSTSSASLN